VRGLADSEGARRSLGGRIAAHVQRHNAADATIVIDTAQDQADLWACQIAYGAVLRSYAYPGYRTVPDPKPAWPKTFAVTAREPDAAMQAFRAFKERADNVHLARDLLAEPPNILTPAVFAERIRAMAPPGLDIEVLDRDALTRIGMGALLAVARGSAQPPYVVIMRWNGAADPAARPLALIGKGVTFDAGGLNIKPGAFMFKLKMDMGGAAAVVGAMRSIAAQQLALNAVGIVGLVENMPSGDAYRPGDVLTTLSGQTVEVIDTDNEGRLVLCDLLTYAQRQFAPRAIIDIATLTGGARMALGAVYAPLFANDDALANHIVNAGAAEGERVWRLPTGPDYDPMIASSVADMTNGRTDIQAHAIVAARFLERFVDRVPWAHIDMAATWVTEVDLDTIPAGMTGFGVALLDRLASDLSD
jgi:leucyl aminopeptidase